MKKGPFLTFSIAAALALQYSAQAAEPPYKDPGLPVEARVEDLLGRMTLEEKVAQMRHIHFGDISDGQELDKGKLEEFCRGTSFGFAEGLALEGGNCAVFFRKLQEYMLNETRLGIPVIITTEALHGSVQDGSTVYPQNIALGSTFNPELAYRKAEAISKELHTMNIRQVLAPNIDVVRDLRWGRVEESFGEDPWLCGQMGIAETGGYLDNGISPMLKHYGAHGNPLGGLNLASVDCGTRDLFEIYLKPFEMVIGNTGVKTVMSSYNSVNRVPNSASAFLMTEILRNRWGFDGLVYSDWGAVDMLKSFHRIAGTDEDAAIAAVSAGLDVEASSNCYPSLVEAVKEGRIDMEVIDQAVRRILRVKFEMGLFENPFGLKEKTGKVHSPEMVALAKEIADESTVLLQNNGSLLPLDIDRLGSIAVIGPNADQVQFGDYSWSKDNKDGVTPLEGIRKFAGSRIKVNYAKGCDLTSLDTSGIREAVNVARESDVVVLCCGSSSTRFVRPTDIPSTCGEGIDLNEISLTGVQEKLVRDVTAAGKPVILVLVSGKPFAIPWEKENIPAIIAQWYAGEEAGTSLADILFGKVNPSGKLNFSFPQSTGHLPVYYNHLPSDKGYYKSPGSYGKPGRDYVFSNPDPLWAFGHGLSYTTFEYLSASSDKTRHDASDTIKVKVTVKNTGDLSGKEVVQVYVRDVVSSTVTPVRQLKAFNKVAIGPGETKEVVLYIPVTELWLTDNDGFRFFEPGVFRIEVGSASDDIRHTMEITAGDCSQAKVSGKDTGIAAVRTEKPSGKTIRVSGTVRDVQATPVEGVAIYSAYDGRKLGESGKGGSYTVKAASDETLLFKSDGYETVSAPVDGKQALNIKMKKSTI